MIHAVKHDEVELGTAMKALPYAIALAASSFLYIAVADLIPGLLRRSALAR